MQGSSTITNCKAGKGGGVHVSGRTFKMQDSAIVTPSTGSEQYTAGKNDVYLESRKTITIDGSLSSNPAARITPDDYGTTQPVLAGDITDGTPQNYTKFTVTPQDVVDGKMFWYITDAGKLKEEVEDLQTLKEAVTAAPADDKPFVIKLAGTIDDFQAVQIPGHKKIMLKADNASKPAILKCPKKDQNEHKHLQVQRDASLTLEGLITLQGADYGSNTQYALYVENRGKAEIKDGVTITGFKNADRGAVIADGTLTMSGGTITGNKAKRGGVYIHAAWRLFTMTGGTIKGNTADKGGGVYVNGDLNGGYEIRGQFLMKGGTITGNTAETNGKAVFVYHGDFKWESGLITANTGSGAAVATDLSGNFNNSTNPRKEPS